MIHFTYAMRQLYHVQQVEAPTQFQQELAS